MKKVSIIIPVYNAEKYLSKAIESVLGQTYTNFELILVNDGSTDESEKICQEYQKRDERILYLYKENGGVCSARNAGIEIASGDYFFFMDNDDEMDSNLLKDNVLLLEKHNADIVKFERKRREFLNDELQVEFCSEGISKLGIDKNQVQVFSNEELRKRFYDIYKANLLIYIWTGIYSSRLIKDRNLRFYEDFKNGHEDILLNMQCYKHAKKIVLNNNVYYIHNWRMDGSASAYFNRKRIDDAILVANYEKELFAEFGYKDDVILSVYMDNLFTCLALMNNLKMGDCDKKTKKDLLKKFRENLNCEMSDVKNSIKRLLKKDVMRAILATTLQMKCYSFVNFLFVVYFQLTRKR